MNFHNSAKNQTARCAWRRNILISSLNNELYRSANKIPTNATGADEMYRTMEDLLPQKAINT